MSETSTLREVNTREFIFLHILRAIALLLILYDHLFPGSYYMLGFQPPVTFMEEYFIWPLAITNYFGAFGVDIFFLISGFAIAHSAKKQSNALTFLIRRFFRIFPPILFGIILFLISVEVTGLITGCGLTQPLLLSYLSANGALWTLKVEICFYFLFAAVLPIFIHKPFVGAALIFGVSVGICQLGIGYLNLFQLGQVFSYVFYILAGILIYFAWSGILTKGPVILASIILWYCIVFYNIRSFNPERYDTGNSFGVSALYAVLFFTAMLLAEPYLKNVTRGKKLSQLSFGVYLHHMPIQALVLSLAPKEFWIIPFLAIFIMALSFFAGYLQVLLVERPCLKLINIMGRIGHEIH